MLPWVYCDPLSEGGLLSVTEAHHALKVLRLRYGDEVIAFNGSGVTRLGTLAENSKSARVNFTAPAEVASEMEDKLALVQCLPNDVSTFELLLKKSCELGVQAIYPVIGDRTAGKLWTADLWAKKQTRWCQILIDACKQSKNPYFPHLHSTCDSLKHFDWHSFDLCLYGSLRHEPKPFIKKGHSMACVIGPEGGFSEEEETFLSTLAIPVRLSPYVLRVETAVVSAVTYGRFH